MDELKVVKTGDYKPVVKEDYLHITIEGPTVDSLTQPEARQMAWAERLLHGFNNAMAGIDMGDMAFLKPAAKAGAKPDGTYLKTFKIFKGL